MVPRKGLKKGRGLNKGWVPPHHQPPWDDDERDFVWGDLCVLATILAVVWALWWLIIHWADHFAGDWLAWYVELLSPVMALPVLWVCNQYGRNPLHWWPMVWGHAVLLDEHNADLVLMDSEAVVKVMGGPMRVWCDIRDKGDVYLKFRRKRDAVWFGLFPYFRSRNSRNKR